MPRNKSAITSIVLAILTMVVSMMLSIDRDIILGSIGILIGLSAVCFAIKGIVNYKKDKTVRGLGFSIAGITLAIWALITVVFKTF